MGHDSEKLISGGFFGGKSKLNRFIPLQMVVNLFKQHALKNYADRAQKAHWPVTSWFCGIFSRFVYGDNNCMFPLAGKICKLQTSTDDQMQNGDSFLWKIFNQPVVYSIVDLFVDRLERMSDLEDVKLENYPKVSHCKAEFQRDLLLCNSKTDALHLDRQMKSSCSVFLSVSSNL